MCIVLVGGEGYQKGVVVVSKMNGNRQGLEEKRGDRYYVVLSLEACVGDFKSIQ
jgi:hypothetical protein